MTDLERALQNIRPGAHWMLHNDDFSTIIWEDDLATKPSQAEVDAEVARLQTPAGKAETIANEKVQRVEEGVLRVVRDHENRLRVCENALAIDGVSDRPPVTTLAQVKAYIRSLM